MKPLYKILIVIGIIILVVLGIYLGWRKITAPEEPAPPAEGGAALPEGAETPPGETPGAGEPPAAAGVLAFKKLSENPVFDFWTVEATKEAYYLTPEGKIFGAKEGPDLEISEQTLTALNFIEAAPDETKILAAFGDPLSPQWGIFDLFDKVWRPLPNDIEKAAWSNNNELIAAVKNKNETNLVRVDLAKTPPAYKIILKDLRLKDYGLTLKSPELLLFIEKPSAQYAGRIWQLNLKTLAFNLLLAPEKGLTLNWSQDKKIAFKFSAQNGFAITDQAFQEILPLFFNTFPQKCFAASSSTAYCFAPQEMPEDLNLPDDYLQKKFFSIDNLFLVDLEAGEINKIWNSNEGGIPAIDAKNLRVVEGKLYFVNRYDNNLYELQLK